jgi:N-acetyl-gamma-glutamylphosphate reductase
MIKVGIVGGTGYTGVELLRLLAGHPGAEVVAVTSRKEAGMKVAEMFPSLRGRVDVAFSTPDETPLEKCDVVFFATPHGVAMAQARELLAAGVKVIDLAADFRLKDPAVFQQWYAMEHSCTDLLAEAVYGLPEEPRCHPRSTSGWHGRLLSHFGTTGPAAAAGRRQTADRHPDADCRLQVRRVRCRSQGRSRRAAGRSR